MSRVLYLDRSTATTVSSTSDARRLHRATPGYEPTPLRGSPRLADSLGVRNVDFKLETNRFGLPSFKVLGASWAAVQALRHVLPSQWSPDHGLAALAGSLPAVTLAAATDGNHGRALAWVARHLGLASRIFVPDRLSDERVAAIRAEGAEVVQVTGTYDDAVRLSARECERDDHVLVSDTSWPGYETVPAAVIDGYATIMAEVEEQLGDLGRPRPDLVLVQLGVGAFGAAVVRHFRSLPGPPPRIVGVEPRQAACVMASLAAGQPVTVPGPHDSVMEGLNCGTPSLVAWPTLRDGLDAVLEIDDASALRAVRTLAADGLAVGECSGVALAAAEELLTGPESATHRLRLSLPTDASVLLFATEGVTDAASYARAVGNSAADPDRPEPGPVPGEKEHAHHAN